MNERIQALIDECTTIRRDMVYDGEDSYVETQKYFDKEKFAEQIVRECISKYDEWAVHSSDRTSFSMARHNVRQTFGIE